MGAAFDDTIGSRRNCLPTVRYAYCIPAVSRTARMQQSIGSVGESRLHAEKPPSGPDRYGTSHAFPDPGSRMVPERRREGEGDITGSGLA